MLDLIQPQVSLLSGICAKCLLGFKATYNKRESHPTKRPTNSVLLGGALNSGSVGAPFRPLFAMIKGWIEQQEG